MLQAYLDSSKKFKFVWADDGTDDIIYRFPEMLVLGGSFDAWGWNDAGDPAPHTLEIEREGFGDSLTIRVFSRNKNNHMYRKAMFQTTVEKFPKLLEEDWFFKFWYWGCRPADRRGQITAVRPAWSTVARRQYRLYIFNQTEITSSYESTNPIFPLRCVEMLQALHRSTGLVMGMEALSRIAFIANLNTALYGHGEFSNAAFGLPYANQWGNHLVFSEDKHLGEILDKSMEWAKVESPQEAIYVGKEEHRQGTKIDFATGIEFFEMNGEYS